MLHLIRQFRFIPRLVLVKLEHFSQLDDFHSFCVSHQSKKPGEEILYTKYGKWSDSLGEYREFFAFRKFLCDEYVMCVWDSAQVSDERNGMLGRSQKGCCKVYMDSCCFGTGINILSMATEFMESPIFADRVMPFST